MHNTNADYLMMIEPTLLATEPLNDLFTHMAQVVYAAAKRSEHSYRGFHGCRCGESSSNYDHVLPDGVITNSLLVHYVSQHREEIPRMELDKLVGIYMKVLPDVVHIHKDDLKFLGSLLPEWATHTPLYGLDPTMYGTGTYLGDMKIFQRLVHLQFIAGIED
jgi:hypothetical protein